MALWLQFAARLMPTTPAIPAYLRITRLGAGLNDVSGEATTLWILAALYLPLAKLTHRRYETYDLAAVHEVIRGLIQKVWLFPGA